MENGAQGRSRTTDTAIFSRMLYQLSYLGLGRTKAGPTELLATAVDPADQARPALQPRYKAPACPALLSGGSSSSSGGGPGIA